MTTPQEQALDHAELESAAAAVVGKIIFAFSRFEFELGLCLRNAVGGVDVDAVNPLIQRLNFKHKLDALLEVVAHRSASTTECVAEFRKWHRSIDALRTKRNSFIHGRWGVHSNAQQVINVAPGMPRYWVKLQRSCARVRAKGLFRLRSAERRDGALRRQVRSACSGFADCG